jgi:hypothetical protein
MNERIKELMEQATTIVDTVNSQGYSSSYAKFDREKFAELIVRECMDLALGSSHREDDMGAIIANKIERTFRS